MASQSPMIDLHCHILPGIDDGAKDIDVSLTMARAFVADDVKVVACTPHILPGLFHNSGPQIRAAVEELQQALDQEGLPLRLVGGADAHIVHDFVAGLQSGHILSLADTRYVLVEPPHHVAPPKIEEFFFGILVAGYVPILTHPERLTWIDSSYGVFKDLARSGVWMQITAGSLTGSFGRRPKYWAEKMLDEGCVHILATDAHNEVSRPPILGEGREAAAKRVGEAEATHLVWTRPLGILQNLEPSSLPAPAAQEISTRVTNDQSHSKPTSRTSRSGGRSGGAPRAVGLSERLQRFFR